MKSFFTLFCALFLTIIAFIAPVSDKFYEGKFNPVENSQIYAFSEKISQKFLPENIDFAMLLPQRNFEIEIPKTAQIPEENSKFEQESKTEEKPEISASNEKNDTQLAMEILASVKAENDKKIEPNFALFEPKKAKFDLKNDENLSIVLIGDSVMQGIYYWGFLSEFKGAKTSVINLSMKNTGLVAGIWKKKLKAELQNLGTQKKLVIAHFGPNDWGDKKNYPFSEKWVKFYKGRIAEIYEISSEFGADVAWLEVPCMKNKNYQERAADLNTIFREVAGTHKAKFIDINSVICGDEGEFVKYKKFDEKNKLLRADDGLHLSQFGAGLIVKEIVKRFEE